MKLLSKYLVAGCLAFVAFTSTPLFAAGTKTVEVVATGFGATQEEAIRNGLAQAVAQVNGTSLKSRQATSTSSVSGVVANSRGESESLNMEITSSVSAQTETSGYIHSYDILSMSHVEKGFEAKLRTSVYRYDAPASSNRQRIALLPVKHAAGYQLFSYKRGSSLADSVGRSIENYLVQSRKFAVLTRQELDEVQSELDLISSDLTSRVEKAKNGRLLGADYILIPEIVSASGRVETKTIEVTGQKQTKAYGSIALSIKVIVAATGEIKFSEQYTSNTKRQDASGLIASVTKKAIDDVVGKIYPKLVVLVDEGRIAINSGGRSVSKGQRFKIYRKGDAVIDPYTGESLGSDESYMATIQITKVLSKMSYGKIVSGEGVEVGMVARPTAPASLKKPSIGQKESKPAAGFRLPFDN
jgi:curli biogenesis system outer membrane secretion channel CsgG